MRERKTAQILALGRYQSPISLPRARQCCSRQEMEENPLDLAVALPSRKVMPREGWCHGQGSSWHPGDGRLLAASHGGKIRAQPRDQHLHPWQGWGSPRAP